MTKPTYSCVASFILWGLVATMLWCVPPAFAGSTGAPEGKDSTGTAEDLRSPEALAELKRATDFLAGLPRLHAHVNLVHDVVQEDGRHLQFEKKGDIYLQRPDRLFVDVKLDDGRHRQSWYDGQNLTIAELSRKQHTRIKAPPTVDEMLDMLEEMLKDPLPLADLFYSDLSPLAQLALEADVVGDSLVNGVPCRHLAFRGTSVDWQLWVEQGNKPFIRKVVISYREVPGVPQFVAWIDLWETPKRFAKDRFTSSPPTGSTLIDVPVAPRSEEGGQP